MAAQITILHAMSLCSRCDGVLESGPRAWDWTSHILAATLGHAANCCRCITQPGRVSLYGVQVERQHRKVDGLPSQHM